MQKRAATAVLHGVAIFALLSKLFTATYVAPDDPTVSLLCLKKPILRFKNRINTQEYKDKFLCTLKADENGFLGEDAYDLFITYLWVLPVIASLVATTNRKRFQK